MGNFKNFKNSSYNIWERECVRRKTWECGTVLLASCDTESNKNSPRRTWGYRGPVRPGKLRQEVVSLSAPGERRNSTFGSFSSASSSPWCWSPSPSPSDTWYDWWRPSVGGRDWLVWRTVLASHHFRLCLNKTVQSCPADPGGGGEGDEEGDIKYKMLLGGRYRNFNGKINMIRIFNLLHLRVQSSPVPPVT